MLNKYGKFRYAICTFHLISGIRTETYEFKNSKALKSKQIEMGSQIRRQEQLFSRPFHITQKSLPFHVSLHQRKFYFFIKHVLLLNMNGMFSVGLLTNQQPIKNNNKIPT